MQGAELTRIQRGARASDAWFLTWLGRPVNASTLRRLRRWKAGDIEVPPDVAQAARLLKRRAQRPA